MAEYVTGHIAKDAGRDPGWSLRRDSSSRYELQQRSLFSDKAWKTLKEVEVMLSADGALGHRDGRKTDDDFIQAHDRATQIF